MSDLLKIDEKTRKGDDYRDYIEVGEDDLELCHRLLYSDEISKAVQIMGKDTFEDIFGGDGDDEDGFDEETRENVQRAQELAKKDESELTDEEREELESLKEEVTGISDTILMLLDPNVNQSMKYVAEKGLCADNEDADQILDYSFEEQKELFGDTAKTLDQARELAEDAIVERIVDKDRDFTAVIAGFQIFMASLDEMGN